MKNFSAFDPKFSLMHNILNFGVLFFISYLGNKLIEVLKAISRITFPGHLQPAPLKHARL